MQTLTQSLLSLVNDFSTTRCRQLVVLSGEQQWAIDLLSKVLKSQQTLWLGDGDDNSVAMNKAHLSLGREYQQLVFNAYSGFHPDAFGQALGSLVGGGVCFMVAPSWTQWSQFNDPDYLRYVAIPEEMNKVSRHFIPRLMTLLENDSQAIVVKQDQPNAINWQLPVRVMNNPVVTPYATTEQQQCVTAVVKVATGHRNRPLVINADRGRGKSSALGISVAQLLTNKLSHIVVTAPKFAALDSVFRHARELLTGCEIKQNTLHWQGKQLEFVAPDELVQQRPDCELLLVDEAAAIPSPMLEVLAKHYSRVVFATTIHGYEGTGRGFALRFLPKLAQLAPDVRRIALSEPVRWQVEDPLEAFCNKLLGLEFKAVNLSSQFDVDAFNAIAFLEITQQELTEDEVLLEQLFGLLVLAHYQTSPSDFRQLLDAPNLRIFIARWQDQILGVSLVLLEGPLTEELSKQVALGKRRLKGHLLPQSLLAQMGFVDAANYRYGRVMRIAVHPDVQQHGIGSALDNHVTQWAMDNQLDVLGSSFGATSDLTQFWLNQGYTPVRLGLNRDSASGTHSLMVIKVLDERVSLFVDEAAEQFSLSLRYDLAGVHQYLEAALVVKLLSTCKVFATPSAFERYNLNNFITGNRPVEQVNYLIEKLLLSNISPLRELSCIQQQLLVGRILQRQSWSYLASTLGFSGKKATQSALRQAVSTWYQAI